LVCKRGLSVVPKGSLEFRIIQVEIKSTIVFLAFLISPGNHNRMALRTRYSCLASIKEGLY
jgi:hypothetical protein